MKFEPSTSFAGAYRVSGPCYSGSASLSAHGLFSHVIAQLDGIGERHGLAVELDGRLLIAWGPKDKVEIGAYRITGDSMHGVWIPPAATGDDLSACGSEKSVRVSENEWRIEQAHDLEKKPYTGTITIEPVSGDQPRIVKILWTLHDGEYRSFGLRGEDWMVSTFNFEPGTPHAIAAYETTADGWKGVQIWKDQTEGIQETLIKVSR